MGVIALDGNMFEAETENIGDRGIEPQTRQGQWITCQLRAGLIIMIRVEMHIAETVHEMAGFQPCCLRHHGGQKRV